MTEKRKNLLSNYYVNYTLIFSILFICCFFWFKLYNKSFFRSYDGLDQHYLIFLYIGKWFRKVFKNIFVSHTLSIPMWDMSMGYGSDIFPTLGLYFPDPFNWISVFFPSSYAEYGFNFSLFLKFYFTGIAFSYFGFHKGYQKNIVLLGSVLYTFSATMYIAFIEAPFINPMYIFPFVIVGVDKILNHESPKVYILALGFAFFNYFYFAYMMCIFTVGYSILYYFTKYSGAKSLKDFVTWILKFLLYSVIAVCLSMAVLLPIWGNLIGQDRLSTDYFLPALYDSGFYKSLLLGFVSFYSMSGRDAIVGFGAITLLSIAYIFSQKEHFINEKIQFIILTIIMCIPGLGSVLNGFSYYANRWVWAYSLCVVNIVCLTIPYFKNINKDMFLKISLFLIGYFALTNLYLKNHSSLFFTTLLIAGAIWLFIYKAHDLQEKTFQRGLIVFTMICVTVQAYYWLNADYVNATAEEVETGTALSSILNGNGIPALSDIPRAEGARFDECGVRKQTNANWISEAYGTDLYISLYNNDIVKFHNSLALNTSPQPQKYFGLNRRSELEYLTGTKYYLVPEGRTTLLPIGFTQLDRTQAVEGDNVSRYSNPEAPPIIFGYDKSVSQKMYDALSPYKRQQLLMRACVTNESDDMSLPDLPDDEVEYSKELPSNIIDNGDDSFTVNEDGAEMVLKISPISDSELYVYFENITRVQDKKDMTPRFDIGAHAQLDGNDIQDIQDKFREATDRNHMYAGKDDWMLNLGYVSGEADSIIVRFEQTGTYRYDAIHVYAKPRSEILKSLGGLDTITDDVKIGINKITARVNTENSSIIYISVPYSKGWTAMLDGKTVPIKKANGAFMAIMADPGHHDLTLTFVTPYLRSGLIISFLSLFILFWLDKMYRNNTEQK